MMTTFLSQVAQITPSLYLSGFVGASEQTILKHGITCILTVCKEVPKINIPFVESIKLDVLDKPTEQLDRYFDFCADKINEIQMRKGVTLVHCVAGISRSASMCIVYLMKYHKMSLRDAHDLVKSKRSFIRPNLGFWKQLVDYEKKLFGRNSVKIISTPYGLIPEIYESELKNMIWPQNGNNPSLLFNANSGTSNSSIQQQVPVSQNQAASLQTKITSITTTSNLNTASAIPSALSLSSKPLTYQSGQLVNKNRSPGQKAYYSTTYNASYGTSKK